MPHVITVCDHKRLRCRSLGDDVHEVRVEFAFALPDDVGTGNVAVLLQLAIGRNTADRPVTLQIGEVFQLRRFQVCAEIHRPGYGETGEGSGMILVKLQLKKIEDFQCKKIKKSATHAQHIYCNITKQPQR